ncbi:MAG: hypothetical protein ABIP44_02145 [Pseudoxanthomonas sp.]
MGEAAINMVSEILVSESPDAGSDTALDDDAELQVVFLDIDSDLRFWRRCYRESGFHCAPIEFDDYIPTLRLRQLLPGQPPRTRSLMDILERRHQRIVSQWQQLDWSLRESIIRETWKRMQQGRSSRAVQVAVPVACRVDRLHSSIRTGQEIKLDLFGTRPFKTGCVSNGWLRSASAFRNF